MRLVMPTHSNVRDLRLVAGAGLIALLIAGLFLVPIVQAQAGAAGTVKGFVRVNGAAVAVKHAYGVSSPDSFDPGKEVKLVLLTPTPIAAGAWAKAGSRNDVFGLVAGNGAIVEIRDNGHNVFIQHAALKGQQLMSGGGFPEFKIANNRISGDVHTFMSGDEDSFGFKVRFELAFDAPIVKTIPLGKPFVAPPPPAPKPVPAGPGPKTKADAIKWLEAQDLGVGTVPNDGLVSYLVFRETWNAEVVRAYLLAGAIVTKPHSLVDGYALNTAALMCEKKPAAVEITKMLLDAGASVNQKDVDGPKATPPMLAVRCPDILKLLLAAKPDLNIVDARGFTVMHHALLYGPRKITAPMVRDAGFDIKRWTPSLKEAQLIGELNDALAPAPPPSSRPAPPPAVAPVPESPRPAAIDWKAVGPYPQRSKAEATKLLSRPGAMTTIDDHFWDGITSHEPQRLALALQAGANVRQLRPVINYTPLLMLADRCDEKGAEAQVSIANQLIAAGADLTGVDPNKANALIVGVNHCPLGVIQAFIKAGIPLQAVSATKSTALQGAILASRVDVVEALLDAGVDPKKEPYNVGKFASGNKPIEAALKKKRK
jgi:ankyrin repeat protein